MVSPDSEEAKAIDMSAEDNRDKGLEEFQENVAQSEEQFLKAVEAVPFLKDRLISMVELAAEDGVL